MSTVRVDSVVYLITTFSFPSASPPSARVNSVSANLTSFLLTFLSLLFSKLSKFRKRGGKRNKKFFEINTTPTRFRIE